MNRRDMIIVAALINAGLLVVLFVSAVKPSHREEKGSLAVASEQVAAIETAVTKPAKTSSSGDQIDQVISEYSAKVAVKESTETKSLPLPVLTPEPKAVAQAEAPKAPLKATTEDFRTVTVEKGDVLERIARHNSVSVEEIMKLNGLSSSRLQIGQVLKLPAKAQTKVAKKKAQSDGKYYIVKGGDNPWTIAQKNGMQVEELLDLNNMDEAKAKRLRPGDKLRIK
ncbi:LysM peptidoglycan-binding domain-containing protein [Simkania sp.]|uniref:LysM peptidoglycan-binding domain-containing protein n=1 Tax=Simkania sp. TaxID=34094 RepID=UPI003B517102